MVAWQKEGGDAFVLRRYDDPWPIGYGELNSMRRDKDHLWLGHIIVRPEERGQGVGRQLVRALVSEAFDQKLAHRVSLIVFPDNVPGIRCYLGVGFAVRGEEHHQFGGVGPKHKLLRLEITPDRVKTQVSASRHVAPA